MTTRLHGVLALWWLAWAAPVGALPPCGAPGTISTVTAPDGGDYIAAFSGYKVYPPQVVPGFREWAVEAAPEYRSHHPRYLSVGPQGRVHVADWTIIYRLEADGSATRIVGVPQYFPDDDAGGAGNDGYHPPRLQRVNVLVDTVAALEARIAPGPMAFDRQGRLYFVDYVDAMAGDQGRRSDAGVTHCARGDRWSGRHLCRPGGVRLGKFAGLRSRGGSAVVGPWRDLAHRRPGRCLRTLRVHGVSLSSANG